MRKNTTLPLIGFALIPFKGRAIFFRYTQCVFVAVSIAAYSLDCLAARENQSFEGLTIASCDSQNDVTTSKYAHITPNSAYATEFDRRELFVASSSNLDSLYQKIGLVRSGQSLNLKSTQLALPPHSDQIASRHVLRKTIRKNSWTIFLEDIQYGSQGGAPGFAIECGTAIQPKPVEGNFVSVSECFSNENKQNFFKTLTDVKASTFQCQPPN
jgi:hypothetical protein